MDALQIIALKETIENQLREQTDDLVKKIAAGCETTDSTEVVCGKMVANAIAISVSLSLEVVLDILTDAGLVKPCSEDELRRKRLSVVRR